MTPVVSFVLPSHNRAPVLPEVLSRLHPDRYPFPTETLVIDNASTDGSVDLVRDRYPWVRLHALDENVGTESRNLGISEGRGQYVMMLDDDSYPLGDSVERGVTLLRADAREQVGCVAYKVRRVDGSLESAGIFTSYVGCGALFRRRALERIGGYPSEYLFYVEEYDVSCRLWGAGLATLNPPDLEVLHLKSMINRDTGVIVRQLVRNNQMMWTKFLPPDLAREQIELELWRYERIAQKEGALSAYAEGLEQGGELRRRWQLDRSFELSPGAAHRVLGLDVLEGRLERLSERTRGRRVLLWGLGKQLPFLIRGLRERGFQPVGIVEGNPCMQGERYDDVPIVSPRRFSRGGYDAVQIASSSLAVNDSLASAWPRDLAAPLYRLCDYEVLSPSALERALPSGNERRQHRV